MKLRSRSAVDRREFMKTAMASGATIATASLMWAEKARAETPKAGGHFRLGHSNGNTSDVLDPAKMVSEFQMCINLTCRNQLVEIDETNTLVPELATGWTATPDAKEWRFKIRQGVSFHNNKTLTAEDVVETFRYHKSPDSASVAASLLKPVTSIAVEGNDTVLFTLAGGNADFPYTLSEWHFTILPFENGKIDAKSGNGTGGYVLKSHEPGVRTEFTRNPNYWKEGRAHFDQATVRAINDATARQNALISGEVDAIDDLDPKTLPLLQRRPGIVVEDVASSASITMPMNVDTPPFNNVDVRLALKLAIDREQVLKTVFRGAGTLGNDYPIAPIMPYWSELPQRKYDPEEAKFHLKKAGAEGLKIQLSAADAAFTGAVDMATLYAEQAAAAGIAVQVVREPDDGYWSNVWLKKAFCMCYWSGRPTPDSIYSLAYAVGAPFNDTHYANPHFNELMVSARAELDQAKRKAIYAEMELIYRDDGGTIIPLFRNYLFACGKQIGHDKSMAGALTLDGERAVERWWFA
jgi:peptide/nickel transport system substrate-binding protein